VAGLCAANYQNAAKRYPCRRQSVAIRQWSGELVYVCGAPTLVVMTRPMTLFVAGDLTIDVDYLEHDEL